MPYGNVLVMSPWNYPFLLSMDPVIEAVAAGNTVVLKPGRAAAATSQVLADLIQDVFVPEYVTVVQGGREENTSLLDEKFDYIFFTGSPSVGKTVMSKAAVHLTPVTLELGGKSPVIVDETANLALSARRIIWGKLLNAGQTCVAPDYIVVHRSVKDALVHQLQKEAKRQANPDSRIIDQKHMDGLVQMLEAQKALGKDVWGGSVDGLHMDLALVQADWDDPVMTQEIFGPILPILEYEDFYGLMDLLKQKDKPLAFYFFSRNKARMEFVKSDMDFGGGCINDVVIQLASDVLPFGGVGASGMGQYHGQYGFDTFSRPKSVVRKGLLIDLPVRYRPFTKVKKGLLKFFLG
jgi:aldehyde dehydrogenase (NAD+)